MRDGLLHTLFMIATALPVPNTTTARTIKKGVFIGTLATASPSTLPTFQINRGSNEPPVNVRAAIGTAKGRLRWSRGSDPRLLRLTMDRAT